MSKKTLTGTTAALVGFLGLGTLSPAVAGTLVADWQMNEKSGSTMTDSSGNRLAGKIGSALKVGVTTSGATGYQWPYTAPDSGDVQPERLVTVAENDKLDPGTKYFSVTIRYRTTRSFGNVVQKGQSGTSGGYWKFQIPRGVAQCLFRDGYGNQTGTTSGRSLSDGAWHVVKCERTATGSTMRVDGKLVNTNTKSVGSINNRAPMVIGGKQKCDQVKAGCDYFTGYIDYVRISR